jgi:hypothetical protein
MTPKSIPCCAIVLFTALSALASAQTTAPPRPLAVPPQSAGTPVAEPSTPAARNFHDASAGVSFTVPAAWNLSRKDADVSTFNLDARSAARTTRMHAVADIAFNPFPYSTFSGAFFYFSVTPRATAAQCAQQAAAKAPHVVTTAQVGGVPFTHGYDEHGGICIESRDEIYTAHRNNACYRFDLVTNTFCGGDVSGVKDMTPKELDAIRNRMQTILDSVHFDMK